VYNNGMNEEHDARKLIKLGTPEQRLREAIAMHEIEDSPLSEEQISMFRMFEREDWSAQKRLDYLNQRHQNSTQSDAAE